MDRRAFLVVLLVACGCSQNEAPKNAEDAKQSTTGGIPRGGNEQPGSAGPTARIPRVALLAFGAKGSASASAPSLAPGLFRDRLTELGYVDGKTVLVEESYADADQQR